jgi:hypothetical protein
MIEATRATFLFIGMLADAVLSVFWWWAPLILAVAIVEAGRRLRPTGHHRGPRARRPAPATAPPADLDDAALPPMPSSPPSWPWPEDVEADDQREKTVEVPLPVAKRPADPDGSVSDTAELRVITLHERGAERPGRPGA